MRLSINVLIPVSFSSGSQEQGFQSAPEPYYAVENNEKGIFCNFFKNTLKYKVKR